MNTDHWLYAVLFFGLIFALAYVCETVARFTWVVVIGIIFAQVVSTSKPS